MSRYSCSRDVRAGCFVCWGINAHWFGKNAQAVAAKHRDRHGHETWVDIGMSIRYYPKSKDETKNQGKSTSA